MKKLIILANLLVLLSINYIQSMEKKPSKMYVKNTQIDSTIKDFYEKDVQPMLKEGKFLNAPLMLKIGETCKDKTSQEKDMLLATILNSCTEGNNNTYALFNLATILVHAGANPNMVSMGESLLHKALCMNVEFLIGALVQYDVDYTYKHYLTGPIFFDAPTKEVVQLFIDKGININTPNDNGHNVLWHLIDSKFPSKLMNFYLKKKVQVNHICFWDGSCVLHKFAGYKEVTNEDNFLTKALLILKKNPSMIHVRDYDEETPTMVAQNTIKIWREKYPTCVVPLTNLIALFEKYEKKLPKIFSK